MYTTEAAWRLHSFSSLSLNRIIRFAHVFSDPADDDGRVIRALSEDERRDASVSSGFSPLLNTFKLFIYIIRALLRLNGGTNIHTYIYFS